MNGDLKGVEELAQAKEALGKLQVQLALVCDGPLDDNDQAINEACRHALAVQMWLSFIGEVDS